MCKIPLSKQLADTGCPTKHDSWWIALNVFYYNLFNTKNNNKNIIWELSYSKIDFKVKYIQTNDFFNKMNCKKPLISLIQYMENDIQNYSPTVMFRGTPCISRNIISILTSNIFNISRITLNFSFHSKCKWWKSSTKSVNLRACIFQL